VFGLEQFHVNPDSAILPVTGTGFGNGLFCLRLQAGLPDYELDIQLLIPISLEDFTEAIDGAF
jgi:hypothetical protein